MMMDWNGYRQRLKSTIGQLAGLSPDTLRGYQACRARDRRPTTSMPKRAS